MTFLSLQCPSLPVSSTPKETTLGHPPLQGCSIELKESFSLLLVGSDLETLSYRLIRLLVAAICLNRDLMVSLPCNNSSYYLVHIYLLMK